MIKKLIYWPRSAESWWWKRYWSTP